MRESWARESRGHHAHVESRANGGRVNERVEDDKAYVGEDRNADEIPGERERKRHARLADAFDHGQRYALDGAGVFQRFGKQRSEHDHDSNALNGPSKPLLERRDECLTIDARHESEQQDGHEDGDEHMPLEPRDCQEQQCDHTDQPGERDDRAIGDPHILLKRYQCGVQGVRVLERQAVRDQEQEGAVQVL